MLRTYLLRTIVPLQMTILISPATASADLYMQRGSANADVEQIIANRLHVPQPDVDEYASVRCRRASSSSFTCHWAYDRRFSQWTGYGRVANVPGYSSLSAPRVRYLLRGVHEWWTGSLRDPTTHRRLFRWASRGAFIYQQGANQ